MCYGQSDIYKETIYNEDNFYLLLLLLLLALLLCLLSYKGSFPFLKKKIS